MKDVERGGETQPGDRKATVLNRQRHQLTLRNRERLSLDGVTNVESFDQEEIVLETDAGQLVVKGEGLHIREFNVEATTLELVGKVRSMEYAEPSAAQKGKGLLSRLFR